MIGKITGRIDYRAADHLLIDVRGVGYLVYCSERTMAAKEETFCWWCKYVIFLHNSVLKQLLLVHGRVRYLRLTRRGARNREDTSSICSTKCNHKDSV